MSTASPAGTSMSWKSCLDCASVCPSLACTRRCWGTGELVASPSSNNRKYLQAKIAGYII